MQHNKQWVKQNPCFYFEYFFNICIIVWLSFSMHTFKACYISVRFQLKFCIKYSTTLVYLHLTAASSIDSSSLILFLFDFLLIIEVKCGSAPSSIKNLITFRWPFLAAAYKGVYPYSFLLLMRWEGLLRSHICFLGSFSSSSLSFWMSVSPPLTNER